MLLIPGVVNVIDGDKSRKSQNYGDTYLSDSRVILGNVVILIMVIHQ